MASLNQMEPRCIDCRYDADNCKCNLYEGNELPEQERKVRFGDTETGEETPKAHGGDDGKGEGSDSLKDEPAWIQGVKTDASKPKHDRTKTAWKVDDWEKIQAEIEGVKAEAEKSGIMDEKVGKVDKVDDVDWQEKKSQQGKGKNEKVEPEESQTEKVFKQWGGQQQRPSER